MENMENNNLFDLGSAPVAEDFDPFAMDEELLEEGAAVKNDAGESASAQQPEADSTASKQAGKESKESAAKAPVPETGNAPKSKPAKAEPNLEEKPPVFAYAGEIGRAHV